MKVKDFFKDFKIHVIVLILVVISELIGVRAFQFGPIGFSLLPMLYALVIGIMLSQVKFITIIDEEDMITASPYIGIAVMYLIGFMASRIGPNLSEVIKAGPALLLQELGNLGTLFLSVPVAVLVLKMDRTAVGSCFSTSRESSMAIVGDVYGLDTKEGRGVMGSYITGTLLGTIFSGILASLMLNISWFTPEALAMASGTGSASMMSAAIAPIVEAFPEKASSLTAFAASSQVLTSVSGIYLSLFVALPLTNWMYNKLKGKEAVEQENKEIEAARIVEEKIIAENVDMDNGEEKVEENIWVTRFKVLAYSGVFALIANWLSSLKKDEIITPLEALPGMLWLLGIVVLGNIIKDFLEKRNIKLPTVLFIALIATIGSIPNFLPTANFMNIALSKLSLLPLATPILAYAGIATGKDMAEFKKQGFKIIIVTLLALAGTYIGSAVIANIVLKMMG